MTEREQIEKEVREQIMQDMMARFGREKEKKLNQYRQLNAFVKKGQTLFTGSSLMEQFPIAEYCMNDGPGACPAVYQYRHQRYPLHAGG